MDMEKGKLKKPDSSRTATNLKDSTNLGHMGSLRLNYQPKSIQRIDLGCSDMQPGLHVEPLTAVAGIASDSVACLWIMFPYLGYLV